MTREEIIDGLYKGDGRAIKAAIEALEQESTSTCKYGVLHKIAEFFQNWDGDETAKMEISVNDMREIADIFRKKARAEWQLKEKALDYNPDEWCHDCSEYGQDKRCCPRYNKVIRNTVEEMKQEPCEDTISREDALKALDYDIKSFEFKSGVSKHMNEIANLLNTIYEIQSDNIKALPPVQPQPKTGQWILLDECSNSGYYCSECHKKLVKEGWSGTVKKIKYCPNCGTKMIEPQESEG